MKSILYIGEKRDFSDRWLISQLKDFYKITFLDVSKLDISKSSTLLPNFFSQKMINLVVNRIYASAIDRYGKPKILAILNLIEKLASLRVSVVNFTNGYKIEIDRIAQFKYFRSQKLPYVETQKYRNNLSFLKSNTFYVVKNISSSRHKRLLIVKNKREILKLKSFGLNQMIFQPLINKKICYRTEFVGDWYVTFSQYLKIQNHYLSFIYGKILTTPLSNLFLKKVISSMKYLGMKAFSIEYFLVNREPIIIDFNCTSNYPFFFIKEAGRDLKKAWLKIIQDEIL